MHADRVARDDNKVIQVVGVLVENASHQGDPFVEGHVTEAKEDHTGVGEHVSHNQIAEILVIRQDDPALRVGDLQENAIGEGEGILVANSSYVVSQGDEKAARR
jgi:hypothetical protein